MTANGQRGVIAAGHERTAEAGAAILRDGGTAIDAAIAAIAMACVCEPILCSPGGGGFAMIRDSSTGDVSVIDFFAHTPLARQPVDDGVREVFADFGTATQAFHIGPATTATPGFVAGLEALQRIGATAPFETLFAAAIRSAREGIRITAFQHHLSTVVTPILTATEGVAGLFAPGGDVLPIGETFRNPGLADALELLTHDRFDSSAVGRACVEMQQGRGHLTTADLAAYEVVERTPLSLPVGDSLVHMNPLPAASGTLVAHTLRHLASSDPVGIARALRSTDEARQRLGDDLGGLSADTLRQRGTTHVSVIDADGAACAVTVSNGEGNGELVDGFGFMLNNVLGEEDVNSFGLSGWPVDTRLSSMMCPTMIEAPDGGLYALGTGGSNRIRSAICHVVVRLCLDRIDLRDAIDAPRLHVESGHLDFEDQLDDRVRTALCELFADHRAWPRPDLFYGGVHAAHRSSSGEFAGAGDARRDGVAIVVAD